MLLVQVHIASLAQCFSRQKEHDGLIVPFFECPLTPDSFQLFLTRAYAHAPVELMMNLEKTVKENEDMLTRFMLIVANRNIIHTVFHKLMNENEDLLNLCKAEMATGLAKENSQRALIDLILEGKAPLHTEEERNGDDAAQTTHRQRMEHLASRSGMTHLFQEVTPEVGVVTIPFPGFAGMQNAALDDFWEHIGLALQQIDNNNDEIGLASESASEDGTFEVSETAPLLISVPRRPAPPPPRPSTPALLFPNSEEGEEEI
jgi:hypothetical protein